SVMGAPQTGHSVFMYTELLAESTAIALGEPWVSFHCRTNLPLELNSITLLVPESATHRLLAGSTATPPRLWKWPCGALVPSIVETKLPSASNFCTVFVPASLT